MPYEHADLLILISFIQHINIWIEIEEFVIPEQEI